MINKVDKNTNRVARHARVRQKVYGTKAAPRLAVYRSLTHIYAQIICDECEKTLVSASSVDKEIVNSKVLEGKTREEQSRIIGAEIAKRALKNNIKTVVFDRGGYLYTGRVKALAEGARENGLEF